jgi:hypothetical protein
MADQLYLSLWFPNFRFEALPAALTCVLRQFATISANAPTQPGADPDPAAKRVSAATVYPISFTESPTYQRIYVNDARAQQNADTQGSIIEDAIAEATEHLHDDMAVEFEMRWNLWTPDISPTASAEAQLDTLWRLEPRIVRIIGFGPLFEDSGYEQNGHIRVDFGLDTPWTLDATEEDRLDDDRNPDSDTYDERNPQLRHDEETARRIQQNVELLLAFTLSVEKNCGISSRLLWTESGEPLAEKLIARLQRLN